MLFQDVVFWLLSLVAIGAALGVVLVRDLFRAALLLVVVFVAVAGLFVLLSAEERDAGGGKQPSILCDAFESVIGAMYLDGGLGVCRTFVQAAVLDDFHELIKEDDYINFKSKLLEHTQGLGNGHPRYLVNSEEGPDHDKVCLLYTSPSPRDRG